MYAMLVSKISYKSKYTADWWLLGILMYAMLVGKLVINLNTLLIDGC